MRKLITIIMFASEHYRDDMIKKEFENVNKSIQVPILFINPTADMAAVKNEILMFVHKFGIKYKSHLSAVRVPNRPHYNRDVLIDDITELHKLYRDDGDIKKLLDNITQLNKFYSEEKLIKKAGRGITTKMTDKCEITGLWLFLHNHKINRDHLKKVYTEEV